MDFSPRKIKQFAKKSTLIEGSESLIEAQNNYYPAYTAYKRARTVWEGQLKVGDIVKLDERPFPHEITQVHQPKTEHNQYPWVKYDLRNLVTEAVEKGVRVESLHPFSDADAERAVLWERSQRLASHFKCGYVTADVLSAVEKVILKAQGEK